MCSANHFGIQSKYLKEKERKYLLGNTYYLEDVMELHLKKALIILGVYQIATVSENRIMCKYHRLQKSISSKISKRATFY